MELFGYVKANKLTEEYIIRQDMNQKNEPTSIPKEYYKNKEFYANNKKINVAKEYKYIFHSSRGWEDVLPSMGSQRVRHD